MAIKFKNPLTGQFVEIPIPRYLRDLVGDSTHRTVSDTEKQTWNEKQDALEEQTEYIAKGSSTKVPQITTNALGQVVKIEEKEIQASSDYAKYNYLMYKGGADFSQLSIYFGIDTETGKYGYYGTDGVFHEFEIGNEVIQKTKAEYEALMPAPLTDGKIYEITDEDGFADAKDIKYNNTTVKDALDNFETKTIPLKTNLNLYVCGNVCTLIADGATISDGEILQPLVPYAPHRSVVCGGFYGGSVLRFGVRTYSGGLVCQAANGGSLTSASSVYATTTWVI